MLRRIAFLLSVVAVTGCWSSNGREVVVYTALDREFSGPVFAVFEKENDIDVLPKFDVESTKTVGLVTAIIHEKNRPRCDVFWNNEIMHTLRLRKLGLLDTYDSPAGKQFPKQYRSSDGTWYGLAARARVLIVNTKVLPDKEEWPKSIIELADEKWQGKCGIARPLFGTTATHAAVLFSHWGDELAKQFFQNVKNNARVLSGNKQVALAVASGQLAFGLTDTDDAIIEKDNGMPVDIIYPDQFEEGLGTLFIPNTLCLIKGSAHPDEARKLMEYLLNEQVERKLAAGSSAQFPVNPNVTEKSRAAPNEPVRWMEVDFEAAADKWDVATEFLKQEFTGGD